MVKFTRRNTRNEIIWEWKKLKGTHTGIQELLTYSKQKLLEEAIKMVNEVSRAEAAWSWEHLHSSGVRNETNAAHRQIIMGNRGFVPET